MKYFASQSKRTYTQRIACAFRSVGIFFLTNLFITVAAANPVLDNVAKGNVSISNNAQTTTITQSSENAIINWKSFNIDKNEITRFNQPETNSIALNRIDPSQGASTIYGLLSSNGRIILINAAGIYFGPSSVVNVGGIIASTSNMSDTNFTNGHYIFDQPSELNGAITNAGKIVASQHGLVALIGSNISNSGVISAKLGSIVLGAGSQFTVDLYGDQLINFAVTAPSKSAKISNTGYLLANGGTILVTARQAQEVLNNVIDMSGVMVANSAHKKNGVIILDGGSGNVSVSGKILAKGHHHQSGGSVKILGNTITLTSTANIDVSGNSGGGSIIIGGDAHGSGPDQNALTTSVASGATLNASALVNGNGGNIVVWSDANTQFHGTIVSQGGSAGGNGGSVETSGGYLDVSNAAVNVLAPRGSTGTWVLDPTSITLSSSANSNITFSLANYVPTSGTSASSILQISALVAALGTSNVIVSTSAVSGSNTTGTGDITVAGNITWSSGNSLTLSAYRSIILNGNITNSGGASVNLIADNSGVGIGSVYGTGSTCPGNTCATAPTGNVSLSGGSVNVYYNPATFGTPDIIYTGGTAPTAYMLIDELGDQNDTTTRSLATVSNSSSMWGNNFALANNIDATATNGWNSGAGFNPIGNSVTPYSGLFDGQSYTITNYSSTQNGLFGQTSIAAIVKNIGMTNALVTLTNADDAFSYGILVGVNDGQITNAYTTGSIINNGPFNDTTSNFIFNFGGMVGDNENSITHSYSTATVTNNDSGGSESMGGIAGFNNTGDTLDHDYYNGTITNNEGGGGFESIGGLIGLNQGIVTNSYTQGSATNSQGSSGFASIGGLIGANTSSANVSSSYSLATVSSSDFGGSDDMGGLIGYNNGTVNNTYFNGSVSNSENSAAIGNPSVEQVGGLIGFNDTSGSLSNSYAITTITNSDSNGSESVGGLVGGNNGAVSSSYALSTLAMTNNDFSGTEILGGLIGYNQSSGTISSSYASVPINNNDSSFANEIIGGLVGQNDGSVDTSYTNSSIGYSTFGNQGTTQEGGLIGLNTGTVNNSYSVGSLIIFENNGSDTLGGLIGTNTGTVQNSYTSDLISITDGNSPNETVGGFTGNDSGGTYVADFFDSDPVTGTGTTTVCGAGSCSNITSGTFATNLTSVATYANAGWVIADGAGTSTSWDGTQFTSTSFAGSTPPNGYVWIILPQQTRPMLAAEWNTQISNAHQLQLMSAALGADYTLTTNIALVGPALNPYGMNNANDIWGTSNPSGAGFIPVGSSATPFTGQLNGQSHTIDSLYINASSVTDVGLFGYTNSAAQISNVGLTNETITAADASTVGGLVGVNNGSLQTVETESGSVTATGSTTNTRLGGLVGDNEGTLSNVGSLVNVTDQTTNSNETDVGGLVGFNGSSLSNSILNAFYLNTSGSGVSSTGSSPLVYLGGLVGKNSGAITNAFVATLPSTTGTATMGSFIGDNIGSNHLTADYWDSTVSALTGCGLGSCTGALSQSTTNMQSFSLFSGASWDIVDYANSSHAWGIYDGNTYPFLQAFAPTELTLSGSVSDLSGTLQVVDNGVLISAKTVISANDTTYSIALFNVNSSDALLVYLSGSGGLDIANAVTIWQGSSITGLNLTSKNLSLGSDATLSLATTDLATALGSYNGGGGNVLYSYTSPNLTLNSGINLSTTTNTTFTLNDNINYAASGSQSVTLNGPVALGTNDVTIGSSTGDYGTVILNNTLNWGSSNTFSVDAVGNIILGSTINAAGTLNLTSGLDIYLDGSVNTTGLLFSASAYRNISLNNAIASSAGGNVVLRTDNTGTGVGTVLGGNANNNISLSGGSGVVSIYYNPAVFGTPDTLYSGGTTPIGYMLINQLGAATDTTTPSLASVSNNNAWWGESFALSTNINASATSGWNAGAGFNPIGDNGTPFTGNFDGQGFTISHYFSTQNGLFGFVCTSNCSSIIQNLGLTQAQVNVTNPISNFDYGVLAGISYGFLLNDYTTGSITNTSPINSLGGLVGNNQNTITSSHSDVAVSNNVTTGSEYIGGLVGVNGSFNNAPITDSYATGNVINVDSGNGQEAIGGLIGVNFGSSALNSNFSTGNVSNTGDSLGGSNSVRMGGFVGWMYTGTINDSYSTGNVSNTDVSGQAIIGGFAGAGGSTINNSYSIGKVTHVDTGTPNEKVGGFAGSSGTFTGDFFDTGTSGMGSTAACGDGVSCAGVTPGTFDGSAGANLSSYNTFFNAGWNIAVAPASGFTWGIVDGFSYPYLTAFYATTPRAISGVAANASASDSVQLYNNSVAVNTGNNNGVISMGLVSLGANNFYYFLEDGQVIADGNSVTATTTVTGLTNTITAPVSDASILNFNLTVPPPPPIPPPNPPTPPGPSTPSNNNTTAVNVIAGSVSSTPSTVSTSSNNSLSNSPVVMFQASPAESLLQSFIVNGILTNYTLTNLANTQTDLDITDSLKNKFYTGSCF